MRIVCIIILITLSSGFTRKKTTFVSMNYHFSTCPHKDLKPGDVEDTNWKIRVFDEFLGRKFFRVFAVRSEFLKASMGVNMGVKLYRISNECKATVIASTYKVDDSAISQVKKDVKDILAVIYGELPTLSGEVVIFDKSNSDAKIAEELKRLELLKY